jgi:ATP-dependent DNA helicase RecG
MTVDDLFSEQELRELLKRDEGQLLEFKSLWDLECPEPKVLDRRKVRDFAAECIAAFANAEGGTLLLGVEDDGTPTGHGYPEEAIPDFLAAPERRLRPAVNVRSQRTRLDGREVLILQVGPAAEAILFEGNGYPCRVGDQVIREPADAINERKQAYRRVGFEQRVRPEATLEDLDLELARQFLTRTVIGRRPIEEALAQYGLILPKAGGHAVTNAALLLFARPPLVRWHPRAAIRFQRVAGTQRQHGTKRNVTQLGRLELPLSALIPEAHRLTEGQIRKSERLHDLFFREMPEYPPFAWQEALVNAVAHRDYADQGREIEVWFYEDHMEVLNPGELVPPVTLNDLRARRPTHASRNPLMVRVLVDAGIMREEGEGVPRMFEEMEESLLKHPEFSIQAGAFHVTLRNTPIFEGPGTEWKDLLEKLPLSVGQRRVLLAHPGGFTNEDYRRLNKVDRDQAYREIQEMVTAGVVTPPEGPGRAATYRLSPELVSARGWLEGRLPVLRSFFASRPHLQNADYRTLFRMTREAALRELRELVSRDFLRMEGERRGARYLPGPRL